MALCMSINICIRGEARVRQNNMNIQILIFANSTSRWTLKHVGIKSLAKFTEFRCYIHNDYTLQLYETEMCFLCQSKATYVCTFV